MQVNFFVVHELKKEQHIASAVLETSDSVIPINETTIKLVTDLNKRFLSQNSFNAIFANQVDSFPAGFITYNQNRTEASLMTFTKSASEILRQRVHVSAPAKGGYLIFADYINHGHFFAVFLIRNTTGMVIEKQGNQYVIGSNIHIDLENLAMACRINCDIYDDAGNEERYLRFVKNDSENLSAYFRDWITMNNSESMRANTKNLHTVLKSLPKPPNEDGIELPEDELMRKAVHYIKGNQKEVNLRQLSLYLYADADKIHNYASANNIALDSEFLADSSILTKYLHLSVKADKFHLKFPREYYNDKIQIHPDDNSVITIRSQTLADKIRQAMENDDA
jgi:nucleoid-associated protein